MSYRQFKTAKPTSIEKRSPSVPRRSLFNILLVKIRAAIASKEIKLNKALDLIQELLFKDISN